MNGLAGCHIVKLSSEVPHTRQCCWAEGTTLARAEHMAR